MSTATYANSAFEAANSAGSYANSAFITANTANTAINTKTSINALNFLSAPSSNTQNTIFLVVDLQSGTPTTRKLSLSVLSERSANFAFQAANSAGSYANAAFSAANSASGSAASSYANSAFETANSSASYANSAFVHANSAFSAANSAGGAAAASSYANSAFETANSSSSYANSAFVHANAAFSAANSASGAAAASSYANSAFIHANAAFLVANSASSNGTGNVSSVNGGYTDNSIIRYDGTSGDNIQNSLIIIADDGAIIAPQAGSVIPFYYDNVASFPSSTTYHGAVAHAHSTGKLYYAHAGWNELANMTDIVGIPATSSHANSAFETANSAGSYANSAFIHANSSFAFANVAANLALSFGATTILEVTHSGSAAYLFSQYDSLNNPNVSAFSATTLGFKLNVSGHPFQIRLGNNTANFDTGLVHVSPTGTLSYGSAAQGQVSGTLFWRIPHDSVGNYKYRCSIHTAAMIGEINVANTAGIYFAYNS